jgi:hypothetical protein
VTVVKCSMSGEAKMSVREARMASRKAIRATVPTPTGDAKDVEPPTLHADSSTGTLRDRRLQSKRVQIQADESPTDELGSLQPLRIEAMRSPDGMMSADMHRTIGSTAKPRLELAQTRANLGATALPPLIPHANNYQMSLSAMPANPVAASVFASQTDMPRRAGAGVVGSNSSVQAASV